MNDYSFPLDAPLTCEVMEERIERYNHVLHAIRSYKSPNIHKKIHLLVKDNIGVSGFFTSAGSYALRNMKVPDAFCISQLRKNSEIDIFGKTHLTELAGFVTTNVLKKGYSELGGFGRNPHGSALDCGGSSVGSAVAVSAGFCDAALGTETRGSLMIPGLLNGVFSFKPTRGTVSRTGIVPLSSSLDAPGVLGRNLEVIETVFNSMLGKDNEDPQSFDFNSNNAKDSSYQRNLLFLIDRQAGHLDLLLGPLSPLLETLKNSGFMINFLDRPMVEFDYKTISSLEIKKDLSAFLKRYGSKAEPSSFEELVSLYRIRPSSHKFGMERLGDALNLEPMAEKSLKNLVQQNVSRANATIETILEKYGSSFLISLSFIDWWSIGGGPSLAIPVGKINGVPLGLMIGTKKCSDHSLIKIAKEISGFFSDLSHEGALKSDI